MTATFPPDVRLHGLTAPDIASLAQQYRCVIKISSGDNGVSNAKVPLELMAQCCDDGATVMIEAEGDNAHGACESLRAFIEGGCKT